jgi:transcription elongation factor GreB
MFLMNKAITKESDNEPEDIIPSNNALPGSHKNYMTPHGYAILQTELRQLFSEERPKIVETVRWAAGNGDRSENGDYIYGKKRLREIDKRIRYLTKRLESAKVIDPKLQQGLKQVFFGATITYQQNDGNQITIKIVGIDEADITHGKISWISPLAKALIKSYVGDTVTLHTPTGTEKIKILKIEYQI